MNNFEKKIKYHTKEMAAYFLKQIYINWMIMCRMDEWSSYQLLYTAHRTSNVI